MLKKYTFLVPVRYKNMFLIRTNIRAIKQNKYQTTSEHIIEQNTLEHHK